jgi:hypothetical protein
MNSSPGIHVGMIDFEGHRVWFRSYRQGATEKEMNTWVQRYAEEARQRGAKSPLIIDVELDKLRDPTAWNTPPCA